VIWYHFGVGIAQDLHYNLHPRDRCKGDLRNEVLFVFTEMNYRDILACAIYLAEEVAYYSDADIIDLTDHELEKGVYRWQRRMRHKDDPHSGDCTNEAHTCERCICDKYYGEADKVLRAVGAMVVAPEEG